MQFRSTFFDFSEEVDRQVRGIRRVTRRQLQVGREWVTSLPEDFGNGDFQSTQVFLGGICQESLHVTRGQQKVRSRFPQLRPIQTKDRAIGTANNRLLQLNDGLLGIPESLRIQSLGRKEREVKGPVFNTLTGSVSCLLYTSPSPRD